jgi:hypothetical protein
MRSRGTPYLPATGSGPKRNSLHKLRPARFIVRTPHYVPCQRKQSGDLWTQDDTLGRAVKDANIFRALAKAGLPLGLPK